MYMLAIQLIKGKVLRYTSHHVYKQLQLVKEGAKVKVSQLIVNTL